jgi:GAF domain-containing protein
MPDMPQHMRLATAMTRLAVTLLNDHSLKADLERLCGLAARIVENCSGASVYMTVDGEPTTVAVTDRVSIELDLVQYEHHDGPCVVALGGEAVRIGYIPEDERFPHFAVSAADRRVLSVLSTPVIDHGSVVGSLNLYSHQANAFDERARDTALVFAGEVAHALVKSSLFDVANTTRDELQAEHDEVTLVSRAEGLLMALQDCSAAQANDLMRIAADENGERLITTAERILATVEVVDDQIDIG